MTTTQSYHESGPTSPQPESEYPHPALDRLWLYFPDEPILINDSPHGFEIDGGKLAYTVNLVNQRVSPEEGDKVGAISMAYSNSLPEFFDNGRPHDTPFVYDRDNEIVALRAPREVVDASKPNDKLATAYNLALHRQLTDGLRESIGLRVGERNRRIAFFGSMYSGYLGGAAVGGSVFFEQTGGSSGRLSDILGGAFVGLLWSGIVSISGVAISERRESRGRAGEDDKAINTIIRRGSHSQPYKFWKLMAEPVIKLVPLEKATTE